MELYATMLRMSKPKIRRRNRRHVGFRLPGGDEGDDDDVDDGLGSGGERTKPAYEHTIIVTYVSMYELMSEVKTEQNPTLKSTTWKIPTTQRRRRGQRWCRGWIG